MVATTLAMWWLSYSYVACRYFTVPLNRVKLILYRLIAVYAYTENLNFAIAPKKIPTSDIITNTESLARQLNPVEAEQLRAGVSKILTSTRPPRPNLPYRLRRSLQELSKNRSIIVLPADKGNATVVLDSDVYGKKMKEIVDNTNTYHKLQRDPTSRIEKKVSDSIKKVYQLEKLSDRLKDHLTPKFSNPPQIYGLPKIHKENIPLRPIVAAIGSPTYHLAKELARILSPLSGNTKSFVKNSTEFSQDIREMDLSEDDILLSFDVVSLFTKVPIDEALEVISQRLNDDDTLTERTMLEVEDICSLIELCLKSTYFQYRDQFYEQVEGAAMGSPLSPIVANIYMEHFEELALRTAQLQPRVWKRYVDDTFVIWQHGAHTVESFLTHLNGQRDSIKFTMEKEQDNQIAFLDVMVRKDGANMTTSVYRKKTHTDRYLNFHSHHHPKVLTGVVKCLRNRAFRVCDSNALMQEIQHLHKTFRSNSYPDNILNPILKTTHTPYTQTSLPSIPAADKEDSKTKILCLPYVRGITEKIEQVCKNISSVKVKLISRPYRTIRQTLVNVKNKIPDERKTGVIYEIPCQDCDCVYIGETGRTLKKRLAEHKQAVRRFDEKNGVAMHVHSHNHHIHWEGARIVDKEQFY